MCKMFSFFNAPYISRVVIMVFQRSMSNTSTHVYLFCVDFYELPADAQFMQISDPTSQDYVRDSSTLFSQIILGLLKYDEILSCSISPSCIYAAVQELVVTMSREYTVNFYYMNSNMIV